jgi:hypothetical protein
MPSKFEKALVAVVKPDAALKMKQAVVLKKRPAAVLKMKQAALDESRSGTNNGYQKLRAEVLNCKRKVKQANNLRDATNSALAMTLKENAQLKEERTSAAGDWAATSRSECVVR